MKRWVAIGILAALCLGLLFSLGSTSDELNSTRAGLKSTQAELASTQAEIETTKGELADLQISYEGLIAGHGYTIKDPTYKKMMNFIREDKTDKGQYIEDEYVCENFAMDVCNNAEEEGIRCAYVNLLVP